MVLLNPKMDILFGFRFSLVCLLAVFLSSLNAQTHSISGTIQNQQSQEKISYCSIFIQGSQIGTIANEDGDFFFHYPDSLGQDSLVVSAIGFQPHFILLDTLQIKDSLQIGLQPNPYTIDRVLLLSKQVDASEVVQKAIKSIKHNYSRKPFYLKTFFREMSFQDEVYQRLIEAAVNVFDPGVRTLAARRRVQVQELRKSEDYRKLGPRQKAFDAMMGRQYNSLVALSFWEPVRYYQSTLERPWAASHVWLRAAFLEEYEFLLEDLVMEGSEEYYKIKYRKADSLQTTSPLLREGHLLIHTQDYGFREFYYVFKANSLIFEKAPGLEEENFHDKLQVRYQKINGTYFLQHVMLTSSGMEGLPFNLDIQREKDGGFSGLRGTHWLLQVNEVITNKKQMEKIRRREMEKQGIDLYQKDFTYNQAFWEVYNAVPMDRKYISAQKDLERKTSLEAQFQKN